MLTVLTHTQKTTRLLFNTVQSVLKISLQMITGEFMLTRVPCGKYSVLMSVFYVKYKIK